MTVLGMLLKLSANAFAVVAGYWVTKEINPSFANPEIFYGMWVGMLAAHLTYLGYTKEGK